MRALHLRANPTASPTRSGCPTAHRSTSSAAKRFFRMMLATFAAFAAAAAPANADVFPSAPAPPTDIVVSEVTSSSAKLSWTPSADAAWTDHYEVQTDDGRALSVTEPSVILRGLTQDSEYYVTVVAVSPAGVPSEAADLVFITPPSGPTLPQPYPSPPTALVVGTVTQTSVELRWTPPPAEPRVVVAGYRVDRDGEPVAYTEVPSVTITGLDPGTSSTFSVTTYDPFRNESRPVSIVVETRPAVQERAYAVTGTATLRTMTKGVLPLRGSADLTASGSAIKGAVTPQPTKARLLVLGAVPVTAAVQFVASGDAAGELLAGRGLRLSAAFRIKLEQFSLFGTVPLAGGTTCQTRGFSAVDLTSPDFTLAAGGTLTGAFAISDLAGCGALNGLVSPLTAGGGNTMRLKLAPQAN